MRKAFCFLLTLTYLIQILQLAESSRPSDKSRTHGFQSKCDYTATSRSLEFNENFNHGNLRLRREDYENRNSLRDIDFPNLQRHLQNGTIGNYSTVDLTECPVPADISIPQPLCDSRTVIYHDFETGYDGWYGNVGAGQYLYSADFTSQYLHVTDRTLSWQGPTYEIPDEVKACISPSITYLWKVEFRLSKSDGTQSNCALYGTDCPVMKYCHMDINEQIRCYEMAAFHPGYRRPDGTWLVWSRVQDFNEDMLDLSDVYAAITISGPEPGVDISIDKFELTMPRRAAYPIIGQVCNNLFINGNATVDPFFSYPFVSFKKNEQVFLKEDSDGIYFNMRNRSKEWSSLKYEIVPGCVRDLAVYRFSAKIWVHDTDSITTRLVVRRPKIDDEDVFQFDTITFCPPSSQLLGFVECVADFQFTNFWYYTPPFDVMFITEGTLADTEWRDLDFKPVQCGNGDGVPGDGGGVLYNQTNTNTTVENCTQYVRVNADIYSDANFIHSYYYSNISLPLSFESMIFYTEFYMDTHWNHGRRFFNVQLEKGNWTSYFFLNNNVSWPIFAEVLIGHRPDCGGFDSLSLPPPDPPSGYCDNLARNGDFEATNDPSLTQWYHTGGGLKLVQNGGTSGLALCTDGRVTAQDGLAIFLDTRCMIEARTYEIKIKTKLVLANYTEVTCEPNDRSGCGICPRCNLRLSRSGEVTKYVRGIADTVYPFQPNEWNDIYGTFTVDSDLATADSVAFYCEGVREGVDICLDDVTIIPTNDFDSPTDNTTGTVVDDFVTDDYVPDPLDDDSATTDDVTDDATDDQSPTSNSTTDPTATDPNSTTTDDANGGTTDDTDDFDDIYDDDTNVIDDDFALDFGRGCLKNGDFETGLTRGWTCNGDDCSLNIVQPGYNGSSYGLSTSKRDEFWWGLRQQLENSCLSEGCWEAYARFKIVDETTQEVKTCDPQNYYQGQSGFCPVIILECVDRIVNDTGIDKFDARCGKQIIGDVKVSTEIAGSTVGPISTTDWNVIYGKTHIDRAMISNCEEIGFFVGWAEPKVNIIIDNLQFKLIEGNINSDTCVSCSQIVQNGDAEKGDIRYWYIQGSTNYGSLAVVSPGSAGSQYAFYHTGRTLTSHGMWQQLDKSCMDLCHKFTVYGEFKLEALDGSETNCFSQVQTRCSRSNYQSYGFSRRYRPESVQCPTIHVSHINHGGTDRVGQDLYNEFYDDYLTEDGWYRFKSTFTLDSELYEKDHLFISISNIPSEVNYYVDNISVTQGGYDSLCDKTTTTMPIAPSKKKKKKKKRCYGKKKKNSSSTKKSGSNSSSKSRSGSKDFVYYGTSKSSSGSKSKSSSGSKSKSSSGSKSKSKSRRD